MKTVFKLHQPIHVGRTIDEESMLRSDTLSDSPRPEGSRWSAQCASLAMALMALLACPRATQAAGDQLALQKLITFSASDDGTQPGALIQGADGCLYGTTGGTSNPALYTNGTVFKLTPGGAALSNGRERGSGKVGKGHFVRAREGSCGLICKGSRGL